jgi:hypothetical protein
MMNHQQLRGGKIDHKKILKRAWEITWLQKSRLAGTADLYILAILNSQDIAKPLLKTLKKSGFDWGKHVRSTMVLNYLSIFAFVISLAIVLPLAFKIPLMSSLILKISSFAILGIVFLALLLFTSMFTYIVRIFKLAGQLSVLAAISITPPFIRKNFRALSPMALFLYMVPLIASLFVLLFFAGVPYILFYSIYDPSLQSFDFLLYVFVFIPAIFILPKISSIFPSIAWTLAYLHLRSEPDQLREEAAA